MDIPYWHCSDFRQALLHLYIRDSDYELKANRVFFNHIFFYENCFISFTLFPNVHSSDPWSIVDLVTNRLHVHKHIQWNSYRRSFLIVVYVLSKGCVRYNLIYIIQYTRLCWKLTDLFFDNRGNMIKLHSLRVPSSNRKCIGARGHHLQGPFCVCAQPVKEGVTL